MYLSLLIRNLRDTEAGAYDCRCRLLKVLHHCLLRIQFIIDLRREKVSKIVHLHGKCCIRESLMAALMPAARKMALSSCIDFDVLNIEDHTVARGDFFLRRSKAALRQRENQMAGGTLSVRICHKHLTVYQFCFFGLLFFPVSRFPAGEQRDERAAV